MADDDRGPDDREPSLELPSLRKAFRRRRVGAKMVKTDAESSYDDSAKRVQVEDRLPETPPEPPPVRTRRSMRIHLPGPVAATLTGAVVGLVMVGLTSGSLKVCTSVRGTSSCGTPGILVLLGITLLAVVLGSLVLRLAGIVAHTSTSLLGVNLVAVVTLLALLPLLDDRAVVLVVPLLSALCFLGSSWLTTTYADAPRG
jgi:hypothetical protein